MKLSRLFCVTLLALYASRAYAAEETKYVSSTFQEIQKRANRDPECGAIISVQCKEDAPRHDYPLDFSIDKAPGDEVIIVLSINLLAGDGVYEKYLLRIDDAIRQELQNQERLKKVQAERKAKAIEESKKKINEISGGKLSYGMSLEDVTAVKGKPVKVEQWQAYGAFTAIYPDMKLFFWETRLANIELAVEKQN